MADFIEISTGEPVHVDFAGFRVSIRRREVGRDGGLSIELTGPGDEEREELLRFDVFRQDPHYHVPAGNPKPESMGTDTPEASLRFVSDCLEHRLPELLRRASHPELAEKVDVGAMADVAARVRAGAAEAPEPTETRRFELTPEIKAQLGG